MAPQDIRMEGPVLPTPPARVSKLNTGVRSPSKIEKVNRHIEIIVSYHSVKPYCAKCTKVQNRTLGNLLALHKGPSDKLEFLGTYGKYSPGCTFLNRRPATRLEKKAAAWNWHGAVVAPNPFLDTAPEVFSAIHPEAQRIAIFLITQPHQWNHEITRGGKVEPTPPKETYYLHFGATQRSLKAYTRAGFLISEYRFLRSKGVNPREGDIIMSNRVIPTLAKTVIREHISKSHYTYEFAITSQCPGRDIHDQHADWVTRQWRYIKSAAHQATHKSLFRATCMTTSLSQEDISQTSEDS